MFCVILAAEVLAHVLETLIENLEHVETDVTSPALGEHGL
jgi:hypothetical protein